jgi:arginine-tRNA-protein transferase
VEKRGDAELNVRIGTPEVDDYRVNMFNLHRSIRGLDHGGRPTDAGDYAAFLLNSPCETVELSLWHQGRLIAVSITDVGESSLSAVYCYFDPQASGFSPGTYAILKQAQLARHLGLQWLYLGLYVAANSHLNYKTNFRPHQRLIQGRWDNFC